MNVGMRIFGAQFGIYSLKNYIPIMAAVVVAAVVGEIAHSARLKRRQLEQAQRLARMRRLVRRQRRKRDLALMEAQKQQRKAIESKWAASPVYAYLEAPETFESWQLSGPRRGPQGPRPRLRGPPEYRKQPSQGAPSEAEEQLSEGFQPPPNEQQQQQKQQQQKQQKQQQQEHSQEEDGEPAAELQQQQEAAKTEQPSETHQNNFPSSSERTSEVD
ncbi:hypothetical protein, conserved [Eimeria tenella]|uniref:Uncharacterized protein n=1 Tax=Eimeria tenella TaxID=5802 RepID=U6KZ81_EIMTE|nr:hypothetical protein, conserved [Eimeria tenella]CDJ42243.1 hypothetical protein, conserved [Eimeria tenella]|eukprot:XP_013232993.1 hypothetical protein, conserved [Eimeria tenella]